MKIYLFDNIIDGHHKKYNNAVFNSLTVQKNIEMINCYSEPTKKVNNKLFNELQKLKKIFKLVLKTKKNDIIHFLYLDNIILVLYILYKTRIINKKIIISGTLHWATDNKYKKKMLRYMFKKNLNIVCHSNYILEQQKQIYKKNKGIFKEIRYPYFPYKSNKSEDNQLHPIVQKKLLQKDKLKILYFGGTRLDKGLDIFLESLKKVNPRNVSVFIIGSEETFDKHFIEANIKKLKVDINIHLNYVNETTAAYIFKNIDYTVLPYREFFAGESGPLIDSLANGIKVVAPNTPIFVKNNVGIDDIIFYESEDSIDLARVINDLKTYEKNEKKNYTQRLKLETFEKKYQEYFKALLGEKL